MRSFLFAGCVLAGMIGAVTSVSAEEEPYSVGDTWGVWKYLPEGEDSDPEEKPRCMLGSRVWPDKGVNFLYVLTGLDYIELQLQVYSENWELPVGKKTKVTLVSMAGPMEFELTAGSENYLTGSLDRKIIGPDADLAIRSVLAYMLNNRGTKIGIGIKFAGSEPQWSIPAVGVLEAHQIRRAIDKCTADLRSIASNFYSKDGGKPTGKTSPFAD